MTVVLCADTPDALAHLAPIRAHWPSDAPPPIWLTAKAIGEHPAEVARWVIVSSRAHGTPSAGSLPDAQTWQIQDYWGDLVPRLSGPCLVRDAMARDMTLGHDQRRQVMITGAARYAWMEEVDALGQRTRRRAQLKLEEDAAVLWLGQAPAAEQAYGRTVIAFAESLQGRRGLRILYRPHPREHAGQTHETLQVLARAGLPVTVVAHDPLWVWLAAADAVVSCFSNACVEAVHLNRVAVEPLSRAVYLMCDEELRHYHALHTGRTLPPLAEQGLVLCAQDASAIRQVLEEALDREATRSFWQTGLQNVVPGSVAARHAARLLAS